MRRLEEAVVRPLRLLVTLVGVFQLITSIRMWDIPVVVVGPCLSDTTGFEAR